MLGMLVTAVKYSRPWINSVKARISSELGQDLLEYALISGLVAIAIAAGFLLLADDITVLTDAIASCIDFDADCPE